MLLAYTPSTWTAVIVGASIFVPLIVTIWLTFAFMRASRNDPDAARLKQAQKDYEAQRDHPGRPRR